MLASIKTQGPFLRDLPRGTIVSWRFIPGPPFVEMPASASGGSDFLAQGLATRGNEHVPYPHAGLKSIGLLAKAAKMGLLASLGRVSKH